MNKIVVGEVEIEVVSLNAYAPNYGRGEKFLQIEIADSVVSFDVLKSTLDGTELPIKYYEENELKCEYVGYGVFKSQYANGKHNVELHMTTMVKQMDALLLANEKLNMALSVLEEANQKANGTIEKLEEQNALLMQCIMEMSEIIYA